MRCCTLFAHAEVFLHLMFSSSGCACWWPHGATRSVLYIRTQLQSLFHIALFPSTMPHGQQPVFLAQELINAIMGEVDDEQSLAACSLVSRSWKLGSSSHLFRTLGSRKTYPHVLGPTNLDAVDALLVFLATCPRARNSVENLTLKSYSSLWGSGTATHTAETLLWNLSRLPELKSLVLDRVSLGDGVVDPSLRFGPRPLHPAARPSIASLYSAFHLKLECLSIVNIDGFGLYSSYLARFLGGFDSIKELRLDPGPCTTFASTRRSPQSVPREELLRVERIVVNSELMLEFLSHTLDPSFLTSMVLGLGDEKSFKYVDTSLETFTHIRDVMIDVPWADRETSTSTLIVPTTSFHPHPYSPEKPDQPRKVGGPGSPHHLYSQ